jgi:AraC-like DNA-binding protein
VKNKAAGISVSAWESDSILLEQYVYTFGSVEPLPKHSHEEYQLGLSFDCQGEYHYRGAYHSIPIGSLSVINSGEVHSPSDRTYLPATATFWMMHIHPKWLQAVISEISEKPSALPVFPSVFLTDPQLNRLFLNLHPTAKKQIFQLEQDTAFWRFFSHLVSYHTENPPSVHPLKSAHAAIRRACDFLHDCYATDISLEQLAAIAGLSRFHFCRLFGKEMGVSASAYQTQLRISRAKKLLLQGIPIATVASLTGFYDQSHFGWHFKRLVGVTPGSYVGKTAIIS